MGREHAGRTQHRCRNMAAVEHVSFRRRGGPGMVVRNQQGLAFTPRSFPPWEDPRQARLISPPPTGNRPHSEKGRCVRQLACPAPVGRIPDSPGTGTPQGRGAGDRPTGPRRNRLPEHPCLPAGSQRRRRPHTPGARLRPVHRRAGLDAPIARDDAAQPVPRRGGDLRGGTIRTRSTGGARRPAPEPVPPARRRRPPLPGGPGPSTTATPTPSPRVPLRPSGGPTASSPRGLPHRWDTRRVHRVPVQFHPLLP